ncbi:MAG TPA: hypothetical protein VK992_03985, partial [Candidatus Caenarcaniphilales bacterium]|nr:hypothetical protein [Candidatus Caenarcaniphilales bacterium]
QRATQDAEPGDTGAAIRLTNLGFAALTVAGSEPNDNARDERLAVAAHAFDDASRTSGALVDLRVALGRARTAAASGTWARAAEAAEHAARLFRTAAPSFLGGRYAQATLRLGGPIAAIGALAHIRSGDAPAAVRHLERARATLLHAEVLNGSVIAEALEAKGESQKATRLRALVAQAPRWIRGFRNTRPTPTSPLFARSERISKS